MRAILCSAALLWLAPALSIAQDASAERGVRLVGGWVGASVAPSNRFGYVTDRQLFVAAIRAQYHLHTFGPVALASTVDIVPLAILSNTPEYRVWSSRQPDGAVVTRKVVTGRSPVPGAGVAPVGLQLYTLSARPVRLFVGSTVGTIWFTRDTPVPDARRFNISAEVGGGAEMLSRDGRALVVGYKFQHLSNAQTARRNPGFDTHLLYVGVMRRRAERRPAHDEPTLAR
jgi:hypothetical protein